MENVCSSEHDVVTVTNGWQLLSRKGPPPTLAEIVWVAGVCRGDAA